ncbi:MAG: DUF2958 domain-containing protein [Dehalococcoidia bacterium]
MSNQIFEASPYLHGPAYQYITHTDCLPSTEDAADQPAPMARVKLFDPTGSWTWYIAGYDPEDRIAWGLVDGFEQEFGSFHMAELVAVRGALGLPLERDLYWQPRPLAECLR